MRSKQEIQREIDELNTQLVRLKEELDQIMCFPDALFGGRILLCKDKHTGFFKLVITSNQINGPVFLVAEYASSYMGWMGSAIDDQEWLNAKYEIIREVTGKELLTQISK